MPLMGCKKCHHEWESFTGTENCDWCGGEPYVLKEVSELETMIKKENGNYLGRLLNEKFWETAIIKGSE
jgi:hypothetical protein